MKKTVGPLLFATAAYALLAGCAQPPPPVQALPPSPTPAEVIDYSIAQAQYRAEKASGNGDRRHTCGEYILGHLPRDPLPARPRDGWRVGGVRALPSRGAAQSA